MHITIQKYQYLKRPLYGATFHNDAGGSSRSESGATSLRRIAAHVNRTYVQYGCAGSTTRVDVETWHGFDAEDNPIITTESLDVDALLSRTGISRDR